MKDFFSLNKNEYKMIGDNFKKTYIGFRLSLIPEIFCGLALLDIFVIIIETIFEGVTNTKFGINLFESLLLDLICILIAVVSYFMYLKNLKEYYEKSNEK